VADDNFVGEIILTPYNFAPNGFAFCDGSIVPISQNTVLFQLIGTQFGGNGTSNFGLPDLRGRAPLGFGQGPGLIPYNVGDRGGQEGVTLNVLQLGSHAHAAFGSGTVGDSASPAGNTWAGSASGDGIYSDAVADVQLSPAALAPAGTSGVASHENRQPLLALNYCICIAGGVFPQH
jgi:microcystin-dependent protein